MTKIIITLKPGADFDATKRIVEQQGGLVDVSMKILGIMSVEMPDSSAATLLSASLTSTVDSIEPDQVVKTQSL